MGEKPSLIDRHGFAQTLKSHQGFNLTSVEDRSLMLHGRRNFGCRRFSFEFERRRH
jgi:hypothetical protein